MKPLKNIKHTTVRQRRMTRRSVTNRQNQTRHTTKIDPKKIGKSNYDQLSSSILLILTMCILLFDSRKRVAPPKTAKDVMVLCILILRV